MENFKLKNVKLKGELGLEATYHEKVVKDNETHWVEKTIRSTIHRHNDMDVVADKFKIHVCRIYGILALGLYKEEKDMNKQEKELLDKVIDDMDIVAVSFSGEEDLRSVLISAKKTVLSGKGKVIVFNTPNLTFTDEKYEFCYELGQISTELTEEVFGYLFKRKFAQLELFGGDAEGEKAEVTAETKEDTPEITAEASEESEG